MNKLKFNSSAILILLILTAGCSKPEEPSGPSDLQFSDLEAISTVQLRSANSTPVFDSANPYSGTWKVVSRGAEWGSLYGISFSSPTFITFHFQAQSSLAIHVTQVSGDLFTIAPSNKQIRIKLNAAQNELTLGAGGSPERIIVARKSQGNSRPNQGPGQPGGPQSAPPSVPPSVSTSPPPPVPTPPATATPLTRTTFPSTLTIPPRFPLPPLTSPPPLPPLPLAPELQKQFLEDFIRKITTDPRQLTYVKYLLTNRAVTPTGFVSMETKPTYFIETGGRLFFLSKILASPERSFAILYTMNSGSILLPRFLYRSKSDGVWRVTPEVNGSQFSKGLGVHYTQETKLNLQLLKLLDSVEHTAIPSSLETEVYEPFRSGFQNVTELNRGIKINTFRDEISPADDGGFLKVLQRCQPGEMNGDCLRHVPSNPLSALEYPDFTNFIRNSVNREFLRPELKAFLPNFGAPPEFEYKISHTLLSQYKRNRLARDILVSVYPALLNGRKIEWHVATDSYRGALWIERIRYSETKITTYGTDNEFINSGILTNKPFEYKGQAEGLLSDEYKEVDNNAFLVHTQLVEFYVTDQDKAAYLNITPLLKHLLPIQMFIQNRTDLSIR